MKDNKPEKEQTLQEYKKVILAAKEALDEMEKEIDEELATDDKE